MGSEDRGIAQAVIETAFGCGSSISSVMANQAHLRSYPQRSTIVHSGERAQHVHLLLDGLAQAVALALDGRLVLIQDYRRGDVFGEGSLLGDARFDNDIVAVETVATAQFSALTFIGLMEKHSAIALAISRVLTTRLAAANRRMVEGATLSSNGRIHAELLRQARHCGNNEIRPAPVLSEFALRVQTARETVSRAISTLEKRGIIERSSDCLKIVAPHRLEELVY